MLRIGQDHNKVGCYHKKFRSFVHSGDECCPHRSMFFALINNNAIVKTQTAEFSTFYYSILWCIDVLTVILMRIIVCIKSVSGIYIKNIGRDVSINPFDLYALNQAKRIKEKCNVEIVCVCMGVPNSLIEIEAREYGCDRMLFLSDEKFAGSDTVATSYTLAQAILKIGDFDYIFCGACSVDGETGQVPVDLASELGIRYLGKVGKVLYEDNGLKVFCNRNDFEYCYEAEKLMVISFDDYIIGKVFSLFQLKESTRVKPVVWNAEDIGLESDLIGEKGSKTEVISVKKISKGKQRNCVVSYDLKELVDFFQSEITAGCDRV